jgi:glucosamine-6-phosphate deaminase
MTARFPDYLQRAADELHRGHHVALSIVPDPAALARRMAQDILAAIRAASDAGRAATLIIPVGPVDQFPILADLINRERISLGSTVLINMDEYLTDDDEWLPLDHPLSFRAYMQRAFYDRLDPRLAPSPQQRVFPDPTDPGAIPGLIARRGGVHACFGGIGINGHIAFNEPPEPGESISDDDFAALPTRVLPLSRETRTINAHTVGGGIDVIPRRCVTIGMREILASRELRLYCNRPWQSAVIRRVLFGPISCDSPASFIRRHPRGSLTITRQVAARPEIALR